MSKTEERKYDPDLSLLADSPFNKIVIEKAKAGNKPPELVLEFVLKGLDTYIKRQTQMAESFAKHFGEQMAKKYTDHAKEIERLVKELTDEAVSIEERYKKFGEYLQKHKPV